MPADSNAQQITVPPTSTTTAVIDRNTDTLEIKIIREDAVLEQLRIRNAPLYRRAILIILLASNLITISALGYTLYTQNHVTPVKTTGWLYSDGSQVVYLFNVPGVGGESTGEAVIYISYIEGKGRVVGDFQKLRATINNTQITLISESSPLAGHGQYTGTILSMSLSPHDTITIWTPYTFTPATDDDYSAAIQRLP